MDEIREVWSLALETITANDLSINLSTEMFGVLLSIPLSFAIARWLDSAGDRERMKRSLQAVLSETRHEVSYFFDELPKAALLDEGDPRRGRHAFLSLVHAAEIANRNVKSATSVARGTFGDRLPSELRRVLSRLDWTWGQIETISGMRVPSIKEKGETAEEMAEFILDGYQRLFGYVFELIPEVENYLKIKHGKDAADHKLENFRELYSDIVIAAVKYVRAIYFEK